MCRYSHLIRNIGVILADLNSRLFWWCIRKTRHNGSMGMTRRSMERNAILPYERPCDIHQPIVVKFQARHIISHAEPNMLFRMRDAFQQNIDWSSSNEKILRQNNVIRNFLQIHWNEKSEKETSKKASRTLFGVLTNKSASQTARTSSSRKSPTHSPCARI